MPDFLLTEPVSIFLTIMAVVLVTPLLSERFRLPGIVGLIVGGILVGPHGLRMLRVSGSIEMLATVGLIYLMFTAGLEVNLHQFNRVRGKSLVFGFFTYMAPQLMGMAFGLWLGMDWPGAVLLGSAFSSHTLIALPVLGRLGIFKNEAVSVTVGATIFTDIVAFVVLAAVTASHGGVLEPAYFAELLILLAGYAFLVLFGLPRLGKLFFGTFHHPTVEFQFVLVALFIAAVLAEAIGVHAVVGAFLAGLAINATLPHRSAVVGHVLFIGQSFFIPVFLVYSGMITDIGVFLQGWQTVLIGAGMTFIAYASKLLAAGIAARLFRYSQDEMMTVWGLSQAQAAVTIPTLIIGMELGLFSESVFNAAIVMVLLTSITSPLIVQRYGRRVHADEGPAEESPLFKRILVPIANPETQEHLITLAAILARASKGILFPMHVAVEVQGRAVGLEHQRKLLEAEILQDAETDIRPIGRVDSSPAKGIVRAAIEQQATLIVMGWRGRPTFRQNIFGSLLDEVVWNAPVPVLVGRLTTPINAVQRVVLVVPGNGLTKALVVKTIDMATTMAEAINAPLLVLAGGNSREAMLARLKAVGTEQAYSVEGVKAGMAGVIERLRESDLVIVTARGSSSRFRSSMGLIAEQLATANKGSLAVVHYP